MWKKILAGVGAIGALAVVGLGAAVSRVPDTLHVERSAVIKASPDVVYPLVADLRTFTAWSPWTDLDPDQTVTFSPSTSGVGAWYTWSGDDKVGSGRMEILTENAPTGLTQRLEFIEPFQSVATVTWTLTPHAGGTQVTWSMDSAQGVVSKLMCVFVDMDAMLGADFERGLTQLQAHAQRG
jgi:hypothetical protein